MHIAAQRGHLNMVKSLLDKGAVNDITDKSGVSMYVAVLLHEGRLD